MKVKSLGFGTDLMLLRMSGSVVTDHGSHLVVRTPENPGFWWGNFVLFDAPPRPGDAARWEAVFAREFPDATHLALGVDGTCGDAGDPAEHARLKVAVEVNSVLTATRLRPSRWPQPDADIRPLSGDEDWAQALELRLACYDSPDSAEYRRFVATKTAEHRRLGEAGHGAWFGAFVDGRMRSGAGLFTDGHGSARFQNVETHPDFRGRGLASSLVHLGGLWGLTSLGARRLVIVADPGYHAIRLYRALGFTDSERQIQMQRPPVTALAE